MRRYTPDDVVALVRPGTTLAQLHARLEGYCGRRVDKKQLRKSVRHLTGLGRIYAEEARPVHGRRHYVLHPAGADPGIGLCPEPRTARPDPAWLQPSATIDAPRAAITEATSASEETTRPWPGSNEPPTSTSSSSEVSA